MDFPFATIRELNRALRDGETSSVELTRDSLAVLDRVGRPLNAIATLLTERALLEATEADRRLRRGDHRVLCGIPYGAKDLFAARGGPTTWGSPTFRDQYVGTDATAVRRLHRDGAVLTAKLAMTELAGAGRPARWGASLHGQGRNPWDPSRYSGGSSVGSAIAVAIGALPFALGTETNGSIVVPAAYCGVTGLRPTIRAVPRGGTMTLSWSLDRVGVLARSAEDCAIVLESLVESGRHTSGPSTAGPGGSKTTIEVAMSVRLAHWAVTFQEVESGIRAALESGLAELTKLTAGSTAIQFPDDVPFGDALSTIALTEAAFGFREFLEQPNFKMVNERQQSALRGAMGTTLARDYLMAQQVPSRAREVFAEVFKSADVLVAPARPVTAPRLDQIDEPSRSTIPSDILGFAANIAGLPAVSVPCGLASDGAPVGLLLVGPARSERLLLALAAAYQQTSQHHMARPALGELKET